MLPLLSTLRPPGAGTQPARPPRWRIAPGLKRSIRIPERRIVHTFNENRVVHRGFYVLPKFEFETMHRVQRAIVPPALTTQVPSWQSGASCNQPRKVEHTDATTHGKFHLPPIAFSSDSDISAAEHSRAHINMM